MLTGADELPEHPDSTAASTPKPGNDWCNLKLILKSSPNSEDTSTGTGHFQFSCRDDSLIYRSSGEWITGRQEALPCFGSTRPFRNDAVRRLASECRRT